MKRAPPVGPNSATGKSASDYIMAAKIEDYALIGDCETAALVDRNGSINWLCWPDFSSEACFAALLGAEENGYWKITPTKGKWKTTRRYRPHTLILETIFEHKHGSFRLIDFMPVRQRNSHVVRIVEGIRGRIDVRMELALRFGYGRTVPWVTHIKNGIRAIAGPNLALLRASVPMHGENMKTVADFTVSRGKRVSFSLAYGISYKPNRFGAYEPTLVGRPRSFPCGALPSGKSPWKFACLDDRSLVGFAK